MKDGPQFGSHHRHATLASEYAAAQALLQHAAGFDRDPEILPALARIGRAAGADRAYVFRVSDIVHVENTHEWCAEGILAMQAELQQIPFTVGEAFWSGFRRAGYFLLEDVEALAYGSELRQSLVEQGIRSLIAAPLWRDGQAHGFVGLDYVRRKRCFAAVEIAQLQGFAATLDLALLSHERKQLNIRLQADVQSARDRIAAMISALPELLFETDGSGIVTGFHQSRPLTFALAPEEVIGRPLASILPRHLVGICEQAMEQARQSGWSEMYDYALRIDGAMKRFALHVTSSGDARERRPQGFLFVVRDITESDMQDTRIRQLGQAAELSTNLIMLTGADRRITWMNQASVTRSGIALKDAIGELPSDILRYSADDGGLQLREFCAILDQGADIQQEVRALDHRGLPYWLDLNVQPLRNRDGEIQGYMVVGSDVTFRKLAEVRALRDRQNTMDASRDAIAIVQPNGRLVYLNPLFRDLLGIARDAPAETLIWQDISPETFAPDLQIILPQLYSRGDWTGEVTLHVTNGSDRYFDTSMSVQDDGSFLIIAREITDRKAAEMQQALLREKLQIAQSRQLVAQLAGGLAHDVANVLAVITQSLEILRPVVPAAASISLERIEVAAEQAQSLVGNLTRLGQRSTARNRIALDQSIAQAADLLRPSLGPDVALHLNLPSSMLAVTGGQTAVMQVMLNLMLNARDAICTQARDGHAEHIRVTLRQATAVDRTPPLDLGVLLDGHDYAVVEIADSGPGIAPEIRYQMLNPYFTTKGAKGAGLGLSIVSDILLQHAGALRVTSLPEQGTVFTVFWPMHDPLSDARAASAKTTDTPLDGMQVLLVDDDDTTLKTFSRVLVRAGADPVCCIDPYEALQTFAADPQTWDAVVTDHDMAGMTGSELASELHKLDSALPVILVTGANRLPSAGNPAIVTTLRKPVANELLVAALGNAKRRSAKGARDETHDVASVDRG